MSLILISLLFVALAVALLSVRILLSKKGRFPNTHVGGNKALRRQGISCHTSQHREAQSHRTLADRVGEIR